MLQGEHSVILLTFIKLPFVIKIFVLSIFEWPFYTDFTVFLLYEDRYPRSKQCRSWLNAALCEISSGSSLFAAKVPV